MSVSRKKNPGLTDEVYIPGKEKKGEGRRSSLFFCLQKIYADSENFQQALSFWE